MIDTHKQSQPARKQMTRLARTVAGLAMIIAGVMLFVLPLTVQQVAVITGTGLAVSGIALLLHRSKHREATIYTVVTGTLLIVAGGIMAFWSDAGAPWLAWLVAAALVLHGLTSAITSLRSASDHRVAGLLTGLTGVLAGIVAFSWPVLTLSLFRLGVGAWLMFVGVRLLFELWHERNSRRPASAPTVAKTTHKSAFARWARTLAAAIALVLAAGAAYGSAQVLSGTPLPTPDDFYGAPADMPTEPGQLIRTQPLTTGVPTGAEAWKMLYTTTAADGSIAVSSGTILAPKKRDNAPLPLLSVSHGTTGVVDGCAPSLSATPFADGAGTAMAEMVVEHGWAAVISDYVGMGTAGTTAYLVGETEAHNVLDASRAALQFNEFSVTSETVVWGHSQGGQGSLWTGQVAEEYAPELSLVGVAAFAPAADLFGLADSDKNSAPGKTVSAYIAMTWNDVFAHLNLSDHLTPGSAGPVDRISALCFNGSDALSAILLGSQVPNQIFSDSLLEGQFGDLLKKQTPTGPFSAPVLVAQGLADPLVLPPLQQTWVDDRCKAGEVIDYRTFEGLGHVDLVTATSPLTPQAIEWTLDRWNDKAAPSSYTSHQYAK